MPWPDVYFRVTAALLPLSSLLATCPSCFPASTRPQAPTHGLIVNNKHGSARIPWNSAPAASNSSVPGSYSRDCMCNECNTAPKTAVRPAGAASSRIVRGLSASSSAGQFDAATTRTASNLRYAAAVTLHPTVRRGIFGENAVPEWLTDLFGDNYLDVFPERRFLPPSSRALAALSVTDGWTLDRSWYTSRVKQHIRFVDRQSSLSDALKLLKQ